MPIFFFGIFVAIFNAFQLRGTIAGGELGKLAHVYTQLLYDLRVRIREGGSTLENTACPPIQTRLAYFSFAMNRPCPIYQSKEPSTQ